MRQPSEEEIRALEAELEKLTVDDVLLQTIVTLLNLGARKAGLVDGSAADLEQTRQAIEGARALMPLVESRHGDQLGPVRDALSQLQVVYVQRAGESGDPGGPRDPGGEGGAPAGGGQEGGGPAGGGQPPEPPQPEGPGPAQRSGRLWIPGQ